MDLLTNVLKLKYSYLFLSLFSIGFSQSKKFKDKQTIYLLFDKNHKITGLKNKYDFSYRGRDGIQFLWDKVWLFYDKKLKIDTILISDFNKKFIKNEKQADSIKKGMIENLKNNNEPIHILMFEKNYVFDTFLLEKYCEKYYIIYPIEWRQDNWIIE